MSLSVRKLTSPIGAVIEGVNCDDFPRRLNRVTVAGEVPASVDGRRSRQLVGDASHYSRILEPAA